MCDSEEPVSQNSIEGARRTSEIQVFHVVVGGCYYLRKEFAPRNHHSLRLLISLEYCHWHTIINFPLALLTRLLLIRGPFPSFVQLVHP